MLIREISYLIFYLAPHPTLSKGEGFDLPPPDITGRRGGWGG
jgi:hypothetical protein